MKTKKSFFYLIVLAVIVFIAFFILCVPKTSEIDFFSMDTLVSLTQQGGSIQDVKSRVLTLDKAFSMYNGELHTLNNSTEIDNFVSNDLANIVSSTLELNEKFGDAIDISSGKLSLLWGISTDNPKLPTEVEILSALKTVGLHQITLEDNILSKPVNTMLDFGSVAKGYACDQVYNEFKKTNVKFGIFSMGSSSLLYGEKPDKSPFSVAIKNPNGGSYVGTISTPETYISTSGGYERYFEIGGVKYSHIFDIATGYPVISNLTSVTVLSKNGIMSDFLSTLILIEGENGLAKHLNSQDYAVIATSSNDKVYISEGVDFTLNVKSEFTQGHLL